MPVTRRPPSFSLCGLTATFDSIPKWEFAEALIQVLLHKHQDIRNHAARREAAHNDLQKWIGYARKKGHFHE